MNNRCDIPIPTDTCTNLAKATETKTEALSFCVKKLEHWEDEWAVYAMGISSVKQIAWTHGELYYLYSMNNLHRLFNLFRWT